MPDLPGGAERAIGTGYAGVGLFFVLSGFVLAYQYHARDLGERRVLFDFAVARFARLYPVYLLGLLLTFPRFAGDVLYTLANGLRSVWENGAIFAGNLLLLQAWTPWTACRWNCPGWSLSAEVFFYALFPLICPLAFRMRADLVPAALLGCWGLGLLVPALAGYGEGIQSWIAQTPENARLVTETVLYNPLLRLPEFVAGILLARLFVAGRRLPAPSGLLAVGGVVAISAAAWPIPRPELMLSNGLFLPLFAALILSVAGGRDWLGRLLAGRPMLLLGEASYSLYILHLYCLLFAAERLAGTDLSGEAKAALFLTGSTALSILSFLLVERPMRGWLKRMSGWLRERRRAALPIAGAVPAEAD